MPPSFTFIMIVKFCLQYLFRLMNTPVLYIYISGSLARHWPKVSWLKDLYKGRSGIARILSTAIPFASTARILRCRGQLTGNTVWRSTVAIFAFFFHDSPNKSSRKKYFHCTGRIIRTNITSSMVSFVQKQNYELRDKTLREIIEKNLVNRVWSPQGTPLRRASFHTRARCDWDRVTLITLSLCFTSLNMVSFVN